MKNSLVILIALSLFGCGHETAPKETSSEPVIETTVTLSAAQIKNAGIETGKPEMKTIHGLLKVNGVIDVPPQNLISISFPLGGFLKSTELLPGMKISKGQAIAVMEDESFIQLEQDYLIAKSQLLFLQKEFDRQKLLNETKSTSDKAFEQTQNDFRTQKITVSGLREKLLLIGVNPDNLNENNISRSVNISSPINGYVSVVNVNVGKYVNPTDVLFELVNPDDLHLALTVFEKDLTSVQPGQNVKASLSNNPSEIFDAKIILVGKKLDESRSALVHCHFVNKEHHLLPGMFLNAAIEVTNQPTIAVPEEAVVQMGDKQFVFLDRGQNRFEMSEVKTGIAGEGFVQISSDKTDLLNQPVIIKNAYAALMKLSNKAE